MEEQTGQLSGLQIRESGNGFSVSVAGRVVLEHSLKRPCVEIGSAEPLIESKSGFFKIREGMLNMKPLKQFSVQAVEKSSGTIEFSDSVRLHISLEDSLLTIQPETGNKQYNRFRIHLSADPDDHVFGGGEQLGKLDLRGTVLPVWLSEPGVGRRFDPLTIGFAIKTGHVPHWYNTYYSMPCWVTTSGNFYALGSSAYSELDFKHHDYYSIYCWEVPDSITVGVSPSLKDAVSGLSLLLGRQPVLPDWIYDGLVLGVQGGSRTVDEKLQRVRDGGMKVSALWCQDWEGRRKTKFGSQLKWAWEYDSTLYPDLPEYIKKLRSMGIRYLGYTNTFLTPGSAMYDEAIEKRYVVTHQDGTPYMVYVPFDPAVLIDFTNEEAVTWLKDILKRNMIDIGMSGWMADFGEMIPHDGQLSSGESGLTYHNRYPVEWARLNAEVVAEAGKTDEIIYFMRAGFTGASRYTSMNWNGDQLVDWSREDGLPSAIMGSLSLGMSGVGYSHSDIGGYTTLAYKKRSSELLIRWAEYAAFTQMMRSHEGNRPESNVQIAGDDAAIRHIARMVEVFTRLKPYHEAVSREYQEQGLPPQRVPVLHYPEELDELKRKPYQYLYGEDLLVAPVIRKQRTRWKVYLPGETWVHLWSGVVFEGGKEVTVDAPIGKIPVFYRKYSQYRDLFEEVGKL